MDQHVWNESNQTLLAWALHEIAPWTLRRMDYAEATGRLEELNRTMATLALYRFRGGEVSLVPKPDSRPLSPGDLSRAGSYLDFFRSIAALLPKGFETTFAANMADEHISERTVPTFCFQKKRGAAEILLPDIDFIHYSFYEEEVFNEKKSYLSKIPKAVFSGSTTGGSISREVLENSSLPRLRAARFFINNDRVEFRLPHITQLASPDVQMLLEQQPFCQKPRMTWAEQLQYRFILSMDGNGATCSRVVIALLSNSVLMKYNSDDVLFYFGGLQPWLHYIPLASDEDVERIIDIERRQPEQFEQMAVSGQLFARKYLNKAAVYHYTAMLLRLYSECFVTEGVVRPQSGELCEVIAHIENEGDCRSGPDGWVGVRHSGVAVEGFTIIITDTIFAGVSYQTATEAGEFSAASVPGQYCGTRGKRQPIFGFRLSISAMFAASFDVVYEAYFRDGSYSGPLRPPMICRGVENAPLEALRISVIRKPYSEIPASEPSSIS